VTLLLLKDVPSLRAGWIAANAFDLKASGDPNESFRHFEQARDLAPNTERWRLELAGFLSRSGAVAADDQIALRFYGEAYNELLEFESRDPYAWDTQLQLASAIHGIVTRGDDSRVPELINRYENISSLMPHFPLTQSNAAEGILAMGAWESAAEVANKAIAMEALTAPLPKAWWTRGEAEFQLGRVEDARISFEASVARSALGPHTERSHRRLAEIAEMRGDETEAEIHRDLANHVARNFAG